MMNLAPNTVPADVNGVYAIIALCADPEAFKQRLDELTEQAKAAGDLLQETAEANRKAAEDRAAAESARAEIEGKLQKLAGQIEARSAELSEREKRVSGREQACSEREDAFDKESASIRHDLDLREKKVRQDEQRLSNLLAGAEAKLADAQKLREEAEARLARINAAAS